MTLNWYPAAFRAEMYPAPPEYTLYIYVYGEAPSPAVGITAVAWASPVMALATAS